LIELERAIRALTLLGGKIPTDARLWVPYAGAEVSEMRTRNCEVCGSELDEVAGNIRPHARRIYDPFECVVDRPVPRCPRCGSLVEVDHSRTTDEDPMQPRKGEALATR
jgi:hypothetical protein